jgi:hypothetical protein
MGLLTGCRRDQGGRCRDDSDEAKFERGSYTFNTHEGSENEQGWEATS